MTWSKVFATQCQIRLLHQLIHQYVTFSVLALLFWVCCITFNIWRALRGDRAKRLEKWVKQLFVFFFLPTIICEFKYDIDSISIQVVSFCVLGCTSHLCQCSIQWKCLRTCWTMVVSLWGSWVHRMLCLQSLKWSVDLLI